MKKIISLILLISSLLALVSCSPRVRKLEIVGDEVKYDESWGSYVVVRPDENGEWHYQIKWSTYPDGTEDAKIIFTLSDNSASATVDSDGVVTLAHAGSVVVTLSAKRSAPTATILVIAR